MSEFRRRISRISLIFLWAAAACGQLNPTLPSATPAPTSVPLRVAVPPPLRPTLEALQTCHQSLDGIAVVPEEVPEDGAGGQDFDLYLTLDVPPAGSAFSGAVAAERILIVLNEANTVDELSASDLEAIYQGTTPSWTASGIRGTPDHLPIEPWGYPQGSTVRSIFERGLGGLEPPPAVQVFLAPDPAAMIEAVSRSPTAIGYIPAAWQGEGLAVVELPPELDSSLRTPLLASTLQAVSPPVRALIACLQTGPGQDVLQRSYEPWSVDPA